MKGIVVLFCLGFVSSAMAVEHRPKGMPDLPPDATTAQMLSVFGPAFSSFREQNPLTRDVIDEVMDLGARNMAWLKAINDQRPDDNKISLTNKETANGYPIEKPNEYSPKIIKGRFDTLRADMPKEMADVLFDGKAITPDLPLEETKFIEWGRATDKLYQSAVRWRGMEPWLGSLESRRYSDVRGIYFFNKMDAVDRVAKLSNPAALSPLEKANFIEWLVSMCLNNGADLSDCRTDVKNTINTGASAVPMFDGWKSTSQALWDEFFTVSNHRSDVKVVTPNLMEMPFRDPNDGKVLSFLRDNIEDEWRFGTWTFKMLFTANAAAHVVFVPGVTPNVNGLGGNRITMNADQPLTEYDAQWTIRHEFGHVLGLPDCYVEFYDVDRQAIVNYQLDVTNLMCSRQGHIQQKHVDELNRVYHSIEPQLH